MIEFPIKGIQNNVLYTKNNEAVAYFALAPYTIGVNNQEQERILQYKLNKMAAQLQSFKDIEYKIIPVPLKVEKVIDEVVKQYEGQYAEAGKYYADRAKKVLQEEIGDAVEYKTFIGIKLKDEKTDEGQFFSDIKSSIKGIKRTFQQLSGLRNKSVDDDTIKKYKTSEEEAFAVITSYFQAYRIKPSELYYILRYQYVRGQEQPETVKSMYNLTTGVLSQKEYGYLKIQQLENESYVSFLPVAEFPIDMKGSAWANQFQTLPFPVEMNIRTIYEGKEKDYKDTNKIKKRFREQDAQLLEANEDEDTLINMGRQLLFELENDIKNQSRPLLRTHVHFVVWGSTKEECRERVNTLKRFFADQSIEIVQPLADQLLLFHQSIPTADIQVKDWEQILTPESFAQSLFSLTRKIGNSVGFYLAKDISLPGESRQTSRRAVFYHPLSHGKGLRAVNILLPMLRLADRPVWVNHF